MGVSISHGHGDSCRIPVASRLSCSALDAVYNCRPTLSFTDTVAVRSAQHAIGAISALARRQKLFDATTRPGASGHIAQATRVVTRMILMSELQRSTENRTLPVTTQTRL